MLGLFLLLHKWTHKSVHDYYMNIPQFTIDYAGNDFDVLAQPVVLSAVDKTGAKRQLLCLDYFNLAALKSAIEQFENERCVALMGG